MSNTLGHCWGVDLAAILGAPTPLYPFRGVPCVLLGPSWRCLGLPWSRPTLSGHLLGCDMELRVWVLAHYTWAQPRRHYTPFGWPLAPIRPPLGLSGAHMNLSWAPPALSGSALDALDTSRFRSCFCAPGVGRRDVRSVVRVRQIQQDSLLKQLWGTRAPKIEAKRAREKHERAPSSTREPRWNAKSCPCAPQGTLKNREMKTQYSAEKSLSREEKTNKHTRKPQTTKSIFRNLHVPHQSASKRTMAPQTAPWCPDCPIVPRHP